MEGISEKIKIGLVDDHELLGRALAKEISKLGYNVTLRSLNGQNMIKDLASIQAEKIPDIMIVDINMPVMDGFETVGWLRTNYPNIKIMILNMFNDERRILKMFKLGVNAYLTKDISTEELSVALQSLSIRGAIIPNLLPTN
jgi:DNA-binding NarL/FixJ family response regulator